MHKDAYDKEFMEARLMVLTHMIEDSDIKIRRSKGNIRWNRGLVLFYAAIGSVYLVLPLFGQTLWYLASWVLWWAFGGFFFWLARMHAGLLAREEALRAKAFNERTALAEDYALLYPDTDKEEETA